jgi:hypothetical protein
MIIFIDIKNNIITEENSALENSNITYKLPNKLLLYLTNIFNIYGNKENIKTYPGYKRLSNIINNNGVLTYDWLRRIKNYFDSVKSLNIDKETDITYILNGGSRMEDWVNKTLINARKSIKEPKNIKMQYGMQNSFIKSHEKGNFITYKK